MNCWCMFFFVLSRDVGHSRGDFSGALEATVAGKRDTVLPRVHNWVWTAGPDHPTHSSGACPCPTWTHASSAHLGHGKSPAPDPGLWIQWIRWDFNRAFLTVLCTLGVGRSNRFQWVAVLLCNIVMHWTKKMDCRPVVSSSSGVVISVGLNHSPPKWTFRLCI